MVGVGVVGMGFGCSRGVWVGYRVLGVGVRCSVIG